MPTKQPIRGTSKKPARAVPAAAKPVSAPSRTASKPAAKASAKPQSRIVVPPKAAAKPVAAKPAPMKSAVSKPTPAAKPPVAAAKPNGTYGPAKPAVNGAARAVPNGKPAAAASPAKTPVVRSPQASRAGASGTRPVPPVVGRPPLPIVRPPHRTETPIPADKDLSTKTKAAKDRIVLMVPDPHWVHAYWELSVASVQRAEAALGQDWHQAKPIIRLFDVTSQDTTSTSEAPLRDISIHGGCSHWYIDVPQPPRSYRADIGYLSRRGQFYVLARSNVVTPPKAGSTEAVDGSGWAAEVEAAGGVDRVLAMSSGFDSSGGPPQLKELFDEQFRRPMKDGVFGAGASLPGKLKKFHFDLDAELIVFGRTDPSATVTLQNEPVKLRADGTFTMRFSLPDSRQIIPAIASSADGLEEQTIVLAVERNIKRLDPTTHDMFGEN